MQEHRLMARAAAPTVTIVRGITTDQLSAPTPCSDFDVRRLVNHLLLWGPSLEAAGRKADAAPPDEVDLTLGDWKGTLEAQTDSLVAAWSEPAAWQGTTRLGSPMELPAPMIGGMVLGEFVVHGWDLARATGQPPAWDDEVLARVYQEAERTAEQGREMGIYGPRVPVADAAPVLDRILGLTGRDPSWAG